MRKIDWFQKRESCDFLHVHFEIEKSQIFEFHRVIFSFSYIVSLFKKKKREYSDFCALYPFNWYLERKKECCDILLNVYWTNKKVRLRIHFIHLIFFLNFKYFCDYSCAFSCIHSVSHSLHIFVVINQESWFFPMGIICNQLNVVIFSCTLFIQSFCDLVRNTQ